MKAIAKKLGSTVVPNIYFLIGIFLGVKESLTILGGLTNNNDKKLRIQSFLINLKKIDQWLDNKNVNIDKYTEILC